MPLHLIKMSVGSASFGSLEAWQQKVSFKHSSGATVFVHGTTQKPQRAGELLKGGSIYWLVKGFIIARNPLVAIDFDGKKKGRARCSLVCALPMVQVVPRRHRGFQGWRYFRAGDAPKDMPRGRIRKCDVPPSLANELADLGLL